MNYAKEREYVVECVFYAAGITPPTRSEHAKRQVEYTLDRFSEKVREDERQRCVGLKAFNEKIEQARREERDAIANIVIHHSCYLPHTVGIQEKCASHFAREILTEISNRNKPKDPVWCEHMTFTPAGIAIKHLDGDTGCWGEHAKDIRFCAICGAPRPKEG